MRRWAVRGRCTPVVAARRAAASEHRHGVGSAFRAPWPHPPHRELHPAPPRRLTRGVIFLAAAGALSAIDGVEAFELLRQVGTKSGFRFGISMEFADRAAYDGYNGHPAHVQFVAERWVPEVVDFLELDYSAPTGT